MNLLIPTNTRDGLFCRRKHWRKEIEATFTIGNIINILLNSLMEHYSVHMSCSRINFS